MAGLRGYLEFVVGPWGVKVQPPVTPLSSVPSYQENGYPTSQDTLVVGTRCVGDSAEARMCCWPSSASRRRREMCGRCRSGDGSRSGMEIERKLGGVSSAPPRPAESVRADGLMQCRGKCDVNVMMALDARRN